MVLSDYAWAYDSAGRVTSLVNADGTDAFSYDDNGQLTVTDSDYQTDESYSYDANGNRTNSGYDTGDNNQLLSDGTYDYEYDAEGNRTRKTEISSGDYVEYAWDHRNRLTAVTFRNSSDVKTKEVQYKYDAFDRRIAKDVDDNPGAPGFDRGERYVYDGSDIVLVFTDAGELTERLLYGPAVDQPLASEDGSGDVRWMLADNQGTVRDVAEYDAGQDETNVVNHLQYGSFGNITAQTNSSEEPRHTYTGREWDADAELYYYRARWYDPVVGKFISEDPIGFGGGDGNLSRYVHNRATNFVDPSGWAEEPNPTGKAPINGNTHFNGEGNAIKKQFEDNVFPDRHQSPEVEVDRVRNGITTTGKVDGFSKDLNRMTELGPASPTGVPHVLDQLKSLDHDKYGDFTKTGLLYKQLGQIPPAGTTYEYVELTKDQMADLVNKIKTDKLTTSAQVWDAAAAMAKGQIHTTQISEAAAERGLKAAEAIMRRKEREAIDAVEKALKQHGDDVAEKTMEQAAESFGKRLLKKGKGALPGPLGLLFAAWFFPDNAQAKGTDRAIIDEALDSTPVVEWAKGGTELLTGKDWVPAPGEEGFFDWYLEMARAVDAAKVIERFDY